MTDFYEITVTDDEMQRLDTFLNGKSISLAFNYNSFSDRWSFDLWIAGELVLTGRRLILGANLLRPFDFGLGSLHVFDWVEGSKPGRKELPRGDCRVISATP